MLILIIYLIIINIYLSFIMMINNYNFIVFISIKKKKIEVEEIIYFVYMETCYF